jgi:hypothetical protein
MKGEAPQGHSPNMLPNDDAPTNFRVFKRENN